MRGGGSVRLVQKCVNLDCKWGFMDFGSWELGVEVWGLGFGVWGLGFEVAGKFGAFIIWFVGWGGHGMAWLRSSKYLSIQPNFIKRMERSKITIFITFSITIYPHLSPSIPNRSCFSE